ncbi:MAG: Vitamin B12 dependent methionine synthase activation subunit [Ruminococcaceae bacterium]|nr:Vitamin B12 dependent methionine synthase activation subunit [Oscillospiraceae bacterium]
MHSKQSFGYAGQMINGPILTVAYSAPPIDRRELLRYMGCRAETEDVSMLIDSVIEEARPILQYRVCYREAALQQNGASLSFCSLSVESRMLAKCLENCTGVILFAATVGLPFDRLLAKYTHTSPSRAVALQALGAERVESLCNAFMKTLQDEYAPKGYALKPRFSPGYGDLSLSFQADLFRVLDCPKRIGVTLCENCLMSPSKSVTAIVGAFHNGVK